MPRPDKPDDEHSGSASMKRWAILCGLAILLIVILADTRRLGFLGVIYDFPNGDKVGHFLLFGLLSLLVNLAVV